MLRKLHIDIETYGTLELGGKNGVGVYRYVEDPEFSILLFAYSWDDGPTYVLDLTEDEYPGESIPADVWRALTDAKVIKVAHNATFEFTCIGAYFGLNLDISQWRCTMIMAAYIGLPLGLDKVGEILNLDEQKDRAGKALITLFCKPCKPTKKNGGRTRNLPEHEPEKWAKFKEYNAQDVRTEKAIDDYVNRFDGLSALEWSYWFLDYVINSTGISLDVELIESAIAINTRFMEDTIDQLKALTGLDNPNSIAQLKAWVEEELGHTIPSVAKDYVADALDGGMLPDHVRQVFELRQLSSRSSIKKYEAMLRYCCSDNKARGQIQFYAARTGRWAGRGIQVQNLTKTIKKGLSTAREAVRKDLVDLLYDDTTATLSGVIRTALIAEEGKSLAVSDFAAIEARCLAWEAGEDWVLDVFNSHGLIYEATAANMFHVPLDQVRSLGLRPKGKVATLALGYQGAAGALIAMGALREGLDESELPGLVKAWRTANPNIVKFWYEVERAAKHVIQKKTTYILRKKYCTLKFIYDRGYLFIELPSGRRLAYYGATVEKKGKFEGICYWGLNSQNQWVKIDTYGGSLVENITQAIARDCLANAQMEMHQNGIELLTSIHDEVVAQDFDESVVDTLNLMGEIMAVPPTWGEHLPLCGDGYISKYYKKD